MDQLLTDIIGFLRAVGPEVVFFATLVETALFIGLLIPAEATVLVAAFLVSEGVFEMEHVLVATLGGALIGDQIGYVLGRFGGRRYAARGGWIGRLWGRSEPRARRMFGRHPIVAVSLARFVSFVRTVMPWLAGMTHMAYGRFVFYDVLGVIGWSVASVMAGYLAGESWRVLASALGTASAILIGGGVLVGILLAIRNRQRLHTPDQAGDPPTRVEPAHPGD